MKIQYLQLTEWPKMDINHSNANISNARETLHRKCLSKISHEVDPFDIIQHVLTDIVEELEPILPLCIFVVIEKYTTQSKHGSGKVFL